MINTAIVIACLFAGALAQMQCPPPDEHANATFFADPEDCHSYYECDNGLPVHVTCPDGLVWNQTLQACDFAWSTPCTTTPPPPPKRSFIHVQALPTCPPPDPTGQRNVTFYPDETDCHKYYECDNGQLINRTCPSGLVWNPNKNVCDFDWAYPCNTGGKVQPKKIELNVREITCPPPNPDGNYNATYYPDDADCHKYFECDNGVLRNLSCPDGLVWSQDLLACDFEWNTPCNTGRRHHHVPPALHITRNAAWRRPAHSSEISLKQQLKLRQKLKVMQRARRHLFHKF